MSLRRFLSKIERAENQALAMAFLIKLIPACMHFYKMDARPLL